MDHVTFTSAASRHTGRHTGRPSASARRSSPLIVGRDHEQDVLREELTTAFGGRGRVVLLGGEAGIGKTSLAQQMIAEFDGETGCTLVGRCYDLTNTPPYGPWRDLFDGYRAAPTLPAPPEMFAGGRLQTVTDQRLLFTDVRRFFAELAEIRPILVLLEDLHWSDPASLELLRHIAPFARHWPMLLLLTYRGEELTRRHPFAQQLPALVREADGLRLELKRLDAVALGALVSARYRLSARDAARLVAYLELRAEGNPLFATELLRALEEDGRLRSRDDEWSLGELDQCVVPSFLRQVIERRVARLGEEVREPLAMAAVIGQDVSLGVWAEVARLGDEELLVIVEQAVDAHLLEAEQDGIRVRFAHALTREALYEGVIPPRRRHWHRQVADALIADHAPDPDAVAFHLQRAGDPRAWEWLVQAGDRAQQAYAWLTAAERLRAAAALLEGVAAEEQTRCRLACRIGWLLRFSDPAGALPTVNDAMRLASRIGDGLRAAELGWVQGTLLFYSDQFRAAIEAMEDAQRRLDDIEASSFMTTAMPAQIWFADALPTPVLLETAEDAIAGARIADSGHRFRQGNLLWAFASSGRPGAEVEACERFVAQADVPGTRGRILAAVAFTYHGLAIAHAADGRPETAQRRWTRARALFASFEHHALTALTLLNEMRDVTMTYGAAAPAARREQAAEAEAALGRAGGALHPGASPRLAWLGCLTLDGRWADVDEILTDMPLPGNTCLRREVTCTRAVLARLRGQTDVAWAQIRPLFPRGPATEAGDLIHQEGLFLQRLAADLSLDAGDRSAARAWLEAHDAWLAWSGCQLGRAEGRVSWARWHWACAETDRARAAADEGLALAASPDQPLVRLASHRLLGEIDTATGAHAAAQGHLTVALELADVCEAPFERALTLLTLADLRAATGAAFEAAALLKEVEAICAPLGAAPALARAAARAGRQVAAAEGERYADPAGLTRREVEVLRLLPRGLSNAEIAAALFVSPRTVQTHLTNLYGKLGVGGRAEAVAYAMARGLA
jgi:DNA-binding CsgD family transcriptional regulator